jgi:dipeptidyl aminopeptidase/acylaminoacyl peptidase
VRELEKHGVPHEVLIKSGEGHGMARLANRVELYTAIEKFLARQLSKSAGAAK